MSFRVDPNINLLRLIMDGNWFFLLEVVLFVGSSLILLFRNLNGLMTPDLGLTAVSSDAGFIQLAATILIPLVGIGLVFEDALDMSSCSAAFLGDH